MVNASKSLMLYIFTIICLIPQATSFAKSPDLSLTESKYGTLFGQIQSLSMGRIRSGNDGYGDAMGKDAHSGSLAITINYLSPELLNFTFGLQYMHVFEMYTGGNYQGEKNAAYNLSNSDFSLLNNVFVKYNFKHPYLKDTNITIGRQSLNLTFLSKYNVRQKDQAFEAIVFQSEAIDKLAITLGHLEKFSSYTSRYDLYEGNLSSKFIDIEKVEKVPYSTKGFQFVEAQYSGIPKTIITLYDYFGHDLYNTFGGKIDYTFNPDSKLQHTLRLHYIKQWDVGKFAKVTGAGVNSNAYQAGIKTAIGNFSIEPGIFKVTGNDYSDSLHTPFQPDYIIEGPLIETDLGFEAGSLSYYLESSYDWEKSSLYLLFLQSKHKHSPLPTGYSREFDLIYSHDITEKIYLKLKLGTVEFDNRNSVRDGWVNDYRLFLGFRF